MASRLDQGQKGCAETGNLEALTGDGSNYLVRVLLSGKQEGGCRTRLIRSEELQGTNK